MTQHWADIESFLKTDLKSEPKRRYVDRRYVVLRTDIKSQNKTKRRLICQTDINSEKRKQRRADTKSWLPNLVSAVTIGDFIGDNVGDFI
jgi:hypothetical protein